MNCTYLNESELIYVIEYIGGKKKCIGKFLSGVVTGGGTDKLKIGSNIMTAELVWYSTNVFLTDEVAIYETSSVPEVTEISCIEFLLMRMNDIGLKQLLAIRQCSDKAQLISAFED